MDVEVADGRLRRGRQTREAVLRHAVDLASSRGLAGVSVGALAAASGISKSGLHALFGSKEALDAAILRRGIELTEAAVVRPALAAPPGLARLRTVVDAYLDWVERPALPGGCLVAALTAELDSQPGPLRDQLNGVLDLWLGLLARGAREAVESGELTAGTDPQQLAVELHALLMSANHMLRLGRHRAASQLRTAIAQRLEPAPPPRPPSG